MRANERTAQYLRLDSCLFQTTVLPPEMAAAAEADEDAEGEAEGEGEAREEEGEEEEEEEGGEAETEEDTVGVEGRAMERVSG